MTIDRLSILLILVVAVGVLAVSQHTASASTDRTAFRKADPPAGEMSMAPRLTSAPDGTLLLSWMEAVPGQDADLARDELKWRMRFARFADGDWSEPRTIVQERDFFVNWADLPSVTQDRDGALLAHWLESSGPGVYAYDIMLARSTDDGETWQHLGPAHDDATQTEHGFVSTLVEEEGIRIFWLDGRAMTGDGEAGHGSGDMQLRTAMVRGGEIGPSTALDMRVCECCNTDAAMTSAGPVVVYRDRGDDEIRDIAIVRYVDGVWTRPSVVHDDGWEIFGCPVNGPAVAARDEVVAVSWFTAAEGRGRVLVAFSRDSGETFTPPMKLDGAEASGRVDIVLVGEEALVAWVRGGEDGQDVVRLQRVGREGPRGQPVDVAEIVRGRQSGFPRIRVAEGGPLVVWTDAAEPMRLRGVQVRADGR